MKKIMSLFLQGLLAIIPLSVSIFTIVWLGKAAESLCGGGIKRLLNAMDIGDWYFSGAGVLSGFILVLLIGMLLQLWVVQRIFAYVGVLMERIPLLKTIYGSVKDLLGMFQGDGDKNNKQVVIVTLADDRRILGLVTRNDLKGLPDGIEDSEDRVAVYIPMSYQIGGFTYFIARNRLKPVDMSVEDAMRFAVTAGVSGSAPTAQIDQPQAAPKA